MEHYDILIVDDDLEDHFMMSEYFKDGGHEHVVKFLLNGQEAIDHLTAIDNATDFPKVIILDLNMPILNGIETLIQLKQSVLLREIPVFIYSTSNNEVQKRKCLDLGAVDYVVKPSSYFEGIKLIERFVSYARQRSFKSRPSIASNGKATSV